MGCRDDGPSLIALLQDEFHQPGLAARIEAGGRLVHQPNLGFQGEQRSQGDAALLSAGKMMRGAMTQLLYPEGGESRVHSLINLGPRQAELEWGEGQLIHNGR